MANLQIVTTKTEAKQTTWFQDWTYSQLITESTRLALQPRLKSGPQAFREAELEAEIRIRQLVCKKGMGRASTSQPVRPRIDRKEAA